MFNNLLCNPKNCLQSTVYVTAQSVWIILYIAFFMGVLNSMNNSPALSAVKNQLQGKMLISVIMMIVFVSILYMFINYLCKKGYGGIAWVVSALPFITAIMIGYQLPKYTIGMNARL